ncbi:MAG: MFS transporter [Oscillospiraceae bacterium]|nr:MFS transporter [Oscillospiraceae bacterium]
MAKKEKKEKAQSKGRRYIGTRETVAYVMFNMAASINIGSFNGVFLERVLNLDLKKQAFIQSFFIGPWDVINDVLFAAIVEKTRTRYGKFRPYLTLSLLAGMPFQIFYYIMPLLFWGTSPNYKPKLLAFLFFGVLNDVAATFKDISNTGMISTLTPNMHERMRLITVSQFLAGMLGDKLPVLSMSVILSVLNFSPLPRADIELKVRSVFLIFGIGTAILSGVFALFFALVSKERVPQSVDRPRIKDSIKAILQNRLLMILSLVDLLGTFSIGGGEDTYYNSVLKFPAGQLVVGIPGFFTNTISYLFIPWARERFSTKTLWIASNHVEPVLSVITYFFGLINKNYTKLWAMIPLLAVREMIWTPLINVRNLLNKDMQNECMDYGEWKCGFRSEAMTGMLRGLVTKLSRLLFGGLNTYLRGVMGFRTGADYTSQTPRVQRFVFGLFLFWPAVTGGVLSLIPKLFYNITKEERDRMYVELAERRALVSAQLTLETDQANAG